MKDHSANNAVAEDNARAAPAPRRAWHRDWLLLGAIAATFAADRLTKEFIKANFYIGESWPAEGFVRITHGTNTGTAFGLLQNQTLFLIVASVAAIGFLAYFYRAYAMPKPILRFAIGLQLGGAFGNLFDRVAYGRVTDFIDVGPWPIFNIADSAICVGIATLIVMLAFFDRAPQDAKASQDAAPSSAARPDVPSSDAPHPTTEGEPR